MAQLGRERLEWVFYVVGVLAFSLIVASSCKAFYSLGDFGSLEVFVLAVFSAAVRFAGAVPAEIVVVVFVLDVVVDVYRSWRL